MEENKTQSSKNLLPIILGVVAIFLCIVIMLLTAAVVYFYTKDDDSTSNKEDETQNDEDSNDSNTNGNNQSNNNNDETIDYVDYTGENIDAELPENWEIIEYFDGEGTEGLMSMGGDYYTGFTGLEIINASGETVFKLNGADGIGGIDWCDPIYKFADTEQSYLDSLNTNDFGFDPAQMIDLSNEDYVQIDFLNHTIRRIGTDLYWDADPNSAFNPACGLAEIFHAFDYLDFDSEDQFTDFSGPYSVQIVDNTSEADLQILDDILGSMVEKP